MNDAGPILAKSLTLSVQQWLQQPTAVSLLHRFDHALNLIDVNGTILSIVQPQIGPGPFSLVLDWERPFPHKFHPKTPIRKTSDCLHIGPLQINWRSAKLWPPTPRWAQLRQQQTQWLNRMPAMAAAVAQEQDRLLTGGPARFAVQFHTATTAAREALAKSNSAGLASAVAQLAGLGPGFTPAGDDFLLGLLLGLWATRPEAEVMALARIVTETAVPRTTRLSAAWLQAATRGEAAQPWHHLLDALVAGESWEGPFRQILATGATSGLAALLGFTAIRPQREVLPKRP